MRRGYGRSGGSPPNGKGRLGQPHPVPGYRHHRVVTVLHLRQLLEHSTHLPAPKGTARGGRCHASAITASRITRTASHVSRQPLPICHAILSRVRRAHTPASCACTCIVRPASCALHRAPCLVRPLGFEPRTCGLRVRCSAVELEAQRRSTLVGSTRVTEGTRTPDLQGHNLAL